MCLLDSLLTHESGVRAGVLDGVLKPRGKDAGSEGKVGLVSFSSLWLTIGVYRNRREQCNCNENRPSILSMH